MKELDTEETVSVLNAIGYAEDRVPLGFEFSFYGTLRTDIGISSNGYLTFGPDLGAYSGWIPSPLAPNDVIA